MGDDITIGVTEIVNNIEVTAQPNDQVVDISVVDNADEVTLNITPSVVEINVNKGSSYARWGTIYGTLGDQTDLANALILKADLVDGLVPSYQLPSYVDDVIEVANYAALPTAGETGKIYITLDDNHIYRWTGSTYVEITDNTAVWGAITGTLSSQTDLQNALNAKANISGQVFTGAISATNLSGTNTGDQDLSGLVPNTRTLTINGTTFDLSANRTYTIPTHDAVTIGTANGLSLSGQELSLGLASSSTTGALSATDWNKFNSSTPAGTPTTGDFVFYNGSNLAYKTFLATSPLSFNVGTGTVSISQATTSSNGYLSSTDWNTFNNKVPTTRTLTINGTSYDLSADRSWTISGLPTMLEYNDTEKTVWNNGQSNIATNTSFGDGALKSLSTGSGNTVYGYRALYSTIASSQNTAIGGSSLYNNDSGNLNTAVGSLSLNGNQTGSNNVSVGAYSGQTWQNISNSVFIGNATSAAAENETNEIVIGYSAIGNGSNSVTLGNTSITKTILRGNVGIGTTSPDTKLQVAGTGATGISVRSNTSGDSFLRLYNDSTINAHWYSDRTNNKIVIGSVENIPMAFDTNATERMRITSGGNVGIGTISPAYKLDIFSSAAGAPCIGLKSTTAAGYSGVHFLNASGALEGHMGFGNSGTGALANLFYFGSIASRDVVITTNDTARFTIYSNGNYSFTGSNVSDKRAKENINELNFNAIEKLEKLASKSYYMKNNPEKLRYGFIAQDVYEVLPDLVDGDIDEEGFVGLDYNGIVSVLVKAMQELKAEIELLKAK